MSILKINNLTKIFPDGTAALKDVSFNVKEGESVIVLGHNGSGKSTLFRCITGLEKPTSGEVQIFESPINMHSKSELRAIRKKIGMVFQTFNLINNISVFQNVLFGALGQVRFSLQAFNLFASDENRERAMRCLDRVGLAHLADRRADRLSGGQKQRVAIARMLMQDPEIILADEPIASLDPKAGKEIMDLLEEIAEERGLTVVTILHQLEAAELYGDRVIVLKEGEIIFNQMKEDITDGIPANIYDVSSAGAGELNEIPENVLIGGTNH